MKSPLRPTLVRRVVLALVLAFVLAWLAVTGYFLLKTYWGMKTDPGLLQIGRVLKEELARIERDERAVAAIESTARQYNSLRRQDPDMIGDLLFQLRDLAGRELYSSAEVHGQSLEGASDRVVDVRLHGHPYWLYQGSSERWRVWIAEPSVGSSWFVANIEGFLGAPFLVAFPFLLLPVWFAVSRGLKPLRALGDRIAQRHAGDLSPLGLAPRYAELAPLVAALDALLDQLRARVQRERAFVQDAAHELRTPLAVISAQAHVLARSSDPGERELAAGHLQQSVARTSHVVAQLLDLATIDAQPVLRASKADVAELARSMIAQAADAAASRGIRLSLDAQDAIPACLSVPLFDTVLRNLLDNAIKYADAGSEVAVGLREGGGVLTLAVADRGPGIPPGERDLVFQRFYRGAGATARGAGLGLPIVREACRRMGGEISLRANPDAPGCLFEVTLPAG